MWLGAEHHLEVGPMGDGEADVGDPDLPGSSRGLIGLAEGCGQPPEPVGGDRGQQPGLSPKWWPGRHGKPRAESHW